MLKIKNDLKIEANKLGFLTLGISKFQEIDVANYEKWLKSGFYGEMKYLGEPSRLEKLKNAKLLFGNVKSIVSFAYPYKLDFEKYQQTEAFISAYARGEDYHSVLMKKIKVLGDYLYTKYNTRYLVCVDTAPVIEKSWAERSNIGFIGKNSLLINKKHGSCVFLGELLLDQELEVEVHDDKEPCGLCEKCLKACPTGALKEPYFLDASKCISYLTIECKGNMPSDLRNMIGNRIYGCDECQLVCPYNKEGRPSKFEKQDLSFYLEMDENKFNILFEKTSLQRIGYVRFMRNVIIACGNSKDTKYLVLFDRKDVDVSLKEYVEWATNKIKGVL